MTVGKRIKRIRTFRHMTMEMTRILNCNYKALDNYGSGSDEDILETLFWLEDSCKINLFNLVPATKKDRAKIDESGTSLKAFYDEDDFNSYEPPVAITFDFGLPNDLLIEWNKKKNELATGAITPEEYFEWKITWSHAK